MSVYEGSASGDFAEWVTKFEVVCRLQKYKDLESIIPLVLKGPAFAVYMQLSAVDKNDYESIKGALTKAFCIGSVQAYELFRQRSLQPGEAIDVFVADLRRLYGLLNAGPCPDAVLKCAVIAGLPDGIKQQVIGLSKMESMSLSEVVDRVRALLTVRGDPVMGLAGFKHPTGQPTCFKCGRPGHMAASCHEAGKHAQVNKGHQRVTCFRCQKPGHVARHCRAARPIAAVGQGNDIGEASLVQDASP